MTSDDDIIEEMRKQFGDGATNGYMKLVGATRGLTYVWDVYVRAEVGSVQEAVLGQAMSQMMNGFKSHPEKATEMIESLLALIQHMRWGGTLEDWFEGFNVSPTPGGDTREERK